MHGTSKASMQSKLPKCSFLIMTKFFQLGEHRPRDVETPQVYKENRWGSTHFAFLEVSSNAAHGELQASLAAPGDGLLGRLSLAASRYGC